MTNSENGVVGQAETDSSKLQERQKIVFGNRKIFIELLTVGILFASAYFAWLSADITARSTEQTIKFESDREGNETWISFREKQIKFERTYGIDFSYPSENFTANREYELVNERLLMAADGITFYKEIDVSWNDPQWQATFEYEFVQASDFFLSDRFLVADEGQMSEFCTYRFAVQDWLVDAFEAQPMAQSKLVDAKKTCERICNQQSGCS